MPRRVLANFDAELLKRLANRSDITAQERSFFLHDAYLWTCISFKHPQIEAETVGTQTQGDDVVVPIATDVWWFETVKNLDNGRVLDVGDKDVIEDMHKQTGVARKFYWWNSQLRVDRKAAQTTTYSLWYIKKVSEFTESPLIDQLFDPVIIMKAASIGLSTVRDFKELTLLNAEIDKYVERWSLPKRESKKVMTGAGVQPRWK